MENASIAPIRVGIVEDQRRTREGLCALIGGSDGFSCIGAWRSMEEALGARPDGGAPQVVLLDIGLPGMDGFEVARRLRAIPALAGAILVAMTGYGSDEDRTTAKEAGFNEYLVKPVDLDLLQTWLRRVEGFAQPR